MFFIGGVASKQRKLNFSQNIICSHCGKYGHYEAIMEYMYLSLFFIPTLKWNRRYYVHSTCCGSVYAIDNRIGDGIERGEQVILTEKDLHIVQHGQSLYGKQCPNCGFHTMENFQYCPRCASPLK